MKKMISMAVALILAVSLVQTVTLHAEPRPIRVAFGGADWENSIVGAYGEEDVWIPDRDTLTFIYFPDTQPMIINDRVFVPVRPVVEQYPGGWRLTWDEDTSTATVTSLWSVIYGDDGVSGTIVTELVMRPGHASVTRRNDQTGEVTLTASPEVLPRIVDGRFMVPMRTLEYVLFAGTVLVWDDETRTVCLLDVAG